MAQARQNNSSKKTDEKSVNKEPKLYTPANAQKPTLHFKVELERRIRQEAELRGWTKGQIECALRFAYDLAHTEDIGVIKLTDDSRGQEIRGVVHEAFVETSITHPNIAVGTLAGQRYDWFVADMTERIDSNVEDLNAWRERRAS